MCEIDSMWEQFSAFREQYTAPPAAVTLTVDPTYICTCGGKKVLNGDEIPTCTSCGATDFHNITDTAEWVSGVDETGKVTDQARCGAPQDLELFSEKWGNSSVLSKGYGRQSYALRRANKIGFHMSMNHKDRALFHAYKDIDMAARTNLNIPESVSRAAKIFYRKFNAGKLTRGAVRTGIKANCLLYACKLNNIPRTTKEIADAYDIPTRDVSRTADLFKEVILGVESATQPTQVDNHAITRPFDVIPRLLTHFVLGDNPRQTTMKCKKMCERLDGCVDLMGKTPNSVASVVVLQVLDVSKTDVCKSCGVSMPTLNKIEAVVKRYLEENSV